MDGLIGIQLVAGLNQDASLAKINANIRNIKSKIGSIPLSIDIDNKTLGTLQNFNKEIQNLSRLTQNLDNNVNKALKNGIVDKSQVDNIKKLSSETEKLGNIQKKTNQDLERQRVQESKSLQEVTKNWSRYHETVDNYKNGKLVDRTHKYSDADNVNRIAIKTNPEGEVISTKISQSNERAMKHTQALAKETQNLTSKQENLRRVISEIGQTGQMSDRYLSRMTRNVDMSKNIDQLSKYERHLNSVQKTAKNWVSNEQMLMSKQVEAQNKVENLQNNVSGLTYNKYADGINSYVSGVNKLTAQTPNLSHELRMLDKDFSGLRQQILQADKGMARFTGQFGAAMARIPIYAAGVAMLYAPLNALKDALTQIVEIDSQMTVLDRVSNGQIQINKVLEDSIGIAERLGNTIGEVNDGLINFARQGYRGDDLTAITEVATVMGNVSDLSIEDSASSLTAAMKAFNIEAEDSIRIVDSLNEVDK